MPTRLIPYVKAILHLLCLVPVAGLVYEWRSGALAKMSDPVDFLTHATGNWGLWLLLVSLTVTPLRRLHPKLANLVRFRRMLGLYAFFYVTLHLATYVFLFSGYDLNAAFDGVRQGHVSAIAKQWQVIWPDVLHDLQTRRFIQVGLVSWVILLALTLTSPQIILRKMGGKNWQRLHRLVYVAAAAACVHYWWLVKRDVTTPLPDTVILTVLLAARLAWELWKRRKKPPMLKPAAAVRAAEA